MKKLSKIISIESILFSEICKNYSSVGFINMFYWLFMNK